MESSDEFAVIYVNDVGSCICKQTTKTVDAEKKQLESNIVNGNKLKLFESDFSVTSYIFLVKYLDLSNCHLKEIDSSITELSNLSDLNVSKNELSSLPDSFVRFKKLHSLNLSENKFTAVPHCVNKLNFLINLNLSHNPIEYIDSSMNSFGFLKRLNLSYTKLKEVPKWLLTDNQVVLEVLNFSHSPCLHKQIDGDVLFNFKQSASKFSISLKTLDVSNSGASIKSLDFLSYFKNIQFLNIGNKSNGLSYNVPTNILWDLPVSQLANAELHTSLVSLTASNVSMSTLSEDISLFSSLKVLDLSYNELDWLPNNFTQLKNLEICILSHNRLSVLPDDFSNLIKLKHLVLNDNHLGCLPEKLDCLINLELLDVYSNNLSELPDTVVKNLLNHKLKGADFGFNYCEFPQAESSDLDYFQLQKTYCAVAGITEERETRARPYEETPDDMESDCSRSIDDASYPCLNFDDKLQIECEEETWEDDNYLDDNFDPNLVKTPSCASLPLANSPLIGFHQHGGYFIELTDAMSFCPADLHAVQIRSGSQPASSNNVTNFTDCDQFQFDDE